MDMDKFCEWKKQETSEEGDVSSTDKRDRATPIKTPRTKKARRLTEPPARTSETEVLIKYGNEERKFMCQEDVAGVIENLAKRNFQRAAHLISANKDLMEEVKSAVLQVIDGECQNLCSRKNNFMLWRSEATDLVDFSFKALHDDLKRLSPFLLGIISTIAKDSAPHICTAASVALRGRCPGLSALSYYVDMVLMYGGAKKSAFTRLAKLGISTVHQSAVTKQKKMAKLCNLPVSSLKRDLEDFFISESQVPVLTEDQSNIGDARDFTFTTFSDDEMASLSVAPLPQSPLPQTYSIIFDNLDFFIHTHHQSAKNTNKSIHWIHHMCVVDRVPSLHLDNKKPEYCLSDYNLSKSLPGPDTQAHMRREFVILGSRLLTNYLDAFKPLASVVVNHIPHQYSEEMAKPSTHYPLGLLFKNENQTSDLMDVLRHLQNEYAPRTPDGLEKVLVGGDRLTEANSRNIQLNVAEGETVEERLEGLFLKFEDWHAVKNLFEVCFTFTDLLAIILL
ncbi:uncharacterized protein PAE49_013275 [Odontesthes bonariensis]|uniref:uncharacterized protein LOC142398626 n=1 Tax=Odontesthes bonariensis TaxID=219752 RepID=UPI003F582C27